ncbi:hypothetical protein BRADO4257 [Bradyrhizobium sp. ORS 278]|uniref:hypothetical protein n=1 Tax=Bradyrhizobium sp. (strain ORS 278) TaxID=114615 RepID=UPI0001508D87|nr:hypothetical protein [Bradyrhizobium sp. ORS 278]CAL78007.1 hypothetical protein BRADO4257 [Bradyrhizobium sp. ORS 278]
MRKHVHFPLKIDAENVDRIRKALAESLELLKQNRPDTFLGRKSYEPFPNEAASDEASSETDGSGNSPA